MLDICQGKTYLYYDETSQEGFSNLATGLLIRLIGDSKNIVYIDTQSKAVKLSNFFENISLSYSFVKSMGNFSLKIYKPIGLDKKYSKTLIPAVEFLNISEDIFINELYDSDVLIFDNFALESIDYLKIIKYLQNKPISQQIILVTSEKSAFVKMQEYFDYKIRIDNKKQNNLLTIKGLTSIYGEGFGKSLYSYGSLLKKFLYKSDVKLIYFDLFSIFKPDINFFINLKKWSCENASFYGQFDFAYPKKQGKMNYEHIDKLQKIRESKDSLMLLKTSVNKQSPVVGINALRSFEDKHFSQDELLNVLACVNKEVLITGRRVNEHIKKKSENSIEFQLI